MFQVTIALFEGGKLLHRQELKFENWDHLVGAIRELMRDFPTANTFHIFGSKQQGEPCTPSTKPS